jgi:antitoxin VapB
MSYTVAKVFKSGNSQAVRLPAEFRFDTEEVFISKEGARVILSPKPASWDNFFDDPTRPTADFMVERIDELPQVRETL